MQVTYLLKGLFGRACRSLGGVTEPVEAIRAECAQLRQLLAQKLQQINTNLEGELHREAGLGALAATVHVHVMLASSLCPFPEHDTAVLQASTTHCGWQPPNALAGMV